MFSKVSFNGPLCHNSKNPRYFTDNSGKAVFLTGSHTWAVMQDIWLEGTPRKNMDYDGFLQMMEDYGHNFMRFWQWQQVKNAPWCETSTLFDPQPYMRTGPGAARDGLPRFDLIKWNETYFDRLRERVEKAVAKGIYVSVMFFEAWGIKWAEDKTDPWPYHPMHPDNNINGITDNPVGSNGRAWDFCSLNCPQLLQWQKEYIKKIVAAVNHFDNVLYEICNEVPNRKEAFEWQDHMAQFIKEYERSLPKQHPVGITAEGGDQDNAVLFTTGADWISPSNGNCFEYRYNPPTADGSKVVINDTDHLWGHGGEVQWIWKSFTRGMNVLFMDPWERIPGELNWWQDGEVSRNQRYYYGWDPIRRNLGYARHFALRIDLNSCVPHDELCTSTYCLASPGNEYLFFFPTGGSEGIDLVGTDGEFAVEWFRPATGTVARGKDIQGNVRHALEAPFDGQAVLYVYKKI